MLRQQPDKTFQRHPARGIPGAQRLAVGLEQSHEDILGHVQRVLRNVALSISLPQRCRHTLGDDGRQSINQGAQLDRIPGQSVPN